LKGYGNFVERTLERIQSTQSGPWLEEEEDREGVRPDSGEGGRRQRGPGSLSGSGRPVGGAWELEKWPEEARRRWGSVRRRGRSSVACSGEGMAARRGGLASRDQGEAS